MPNKRGGKPSRAANNNKKYTYTKAKGKTFVNPYTFIPYNREKLNQERTKAWQGTDQVSGYLDCRLTVKTPVAIPDAEKKDEKKGIMYFPFFSVGHGEEQEYRIPGSSLRGMLRNVYEAVTNSCFSTMREDTRFSKRANVGEKFLPGILIRTRTENGPEWKLYEADNYMVLCKGYKKNRNWHYLEQDSIELNYQCKEVNGERVLMSLSGGEKFHYGDPVLIKCENPNFSTYKNGSEIYYWKGVVDTFCEDSSEEPQGYLFVGEPLIWKSGERAGVNKHGEQIFCKGKQVASFTSDQIETELQLLKKSLDIYRNSSMNREYGKNHFGYAGFERAEENGALPIWYNEQSKRFSLAYAGRLSNQITLNEIVCQSAPCQSRKKVCRACDLFGMVGDGTGALGSRIRVTDARLTERDKKTSSFDKVVLKELAGPKNSYLQFYSKKNPASPKEKIAAGNSYDDAGVDIRGRKFYWHYGLMEGALNPECYQATQEEIENVSKRERLGMFELLKEGGFRFRIYYDQITCKQLEELMWCITLGENDENGRYWHKIGHGKPLGLGSCKVTIEKDVRRSFDTGGYVWKAKEDPGELAGNFCEGGEWKEELLKVCDSKAMEGKNVSYPYIDNPGHIEDKGNNLASHQWFKIFKGKEARKTLPSVMDENQMLPVYQIVENK